MRLKNYLIPFLIVMCSLCSAAIIHVPGDQPTIQAGINAAVDGDTVLVASGTYSGPGNRNLTFPAVSMVVMSESGPEDCIIDCQGSSINEHRGFIITGNGGLMKTIEGFTIKNGYASRSGDDHGGAVYVADDTVTFRHCIIKDNYADVGGAIFTSQCDQVNLIQCEITQNNALLSGVCMFDGSDLDRVVMDQCDVYSNEILNGVTINTNVSLTITCSKIRNNGTGSFYSDTFMEMINCLIIYNAGGISIRGTAEFTNCTIAFNPANSGSMDAISIDDDGRVFLRNSIVWANSNITELRAGDGTFYVDFSDIQGGYPGDSNLDADPDFAATGTDYFYLSQRDAGQPDDSPCINAGRREALNTCFETYDGQICMDDYTTRTDAGADAVMVDLGYHRLVSEVPTPTPSPMPTTTPTPVLDSGVILELNRGIYHSGDNFLLLAYLMNNTGADLPVNLAVILDVYGALFYYPGWSQVFDSESIDLSPGVDPYVVLQFTWPDVAGSALDIRFYGAMLDADYSAIIGRWDMAVFGWE